MRALGAALAVFALVFCVLALCCVFFGSTKRGPQASSGLTALAAKWREAADDVHCGTLAERKVLRRCADELEVALRGVK